MTTLQSLKRPLPFAALCMMVLAFFAAPALGDNASQAPSDIVAVAQQAGRFSTFLKAVDAAGLTGKLKTEKYTVFAPTDEAFAKLAPGTLDDLMKPENKAKLVSLVEYHIVPRMLPASMFSKTSSTTHDVGTLDNRKLTFRSDNAGVTVDNAKVEEADIKASNGVIHAIDTVLSPPSR